MAGGELIWTSPYLVESHLLFVVVDQDGGIVPECACAHNRVFLDCCGLGLFGPRFRRRQLGARTLDRCFQIVDVELGERLTNFDLVIVVGQDLADRACQRGMSVGFITAAALVHSLIEASDEKRLLRLQRQLAGYKLLIIDELGYVPLSPTGAELLFEVFSRRYERGSTMVTSNLPFDEWTSVFGSERLTGALLDCLTHHVHILEMNGDSYRLAESKRRSRKPPPAAPKK